MSKVCNQENDSLPWVEKYRPDKLSKIVHHPNIIYALKQLIKKGQVPHMLFYGASGTGKTSTILAVAKKLYNEIEYTVKHTEQVAKRYGYIQSFYIYL